MQYSMAQFFGAVTLLVVAFACVRLISSSPEAIVATIILAWTAHGIVCDMVERLSTSGRKGKRVL